MQRLLAAAEEILRLEDDTVDREQWAELVRMAEEVAAANAAVFARAREIEQLRGKPISPASGALLSWLERDIEAFAELLERGGR
jgi:hypothetical protein